MDRAIILIEQLDTLSDSDLSELNGMIYGIQKKRAYARFDKGDFDPLNAFEKDLVATGQKIMAVKEYKDRTKQSLYLSYTVVNHWQDMGEECDCNVPHAPVLAQ